MDKNEIWNMESWSVPLMLYQIQSVWFQVESVQREYFPRYFWQNYTWMCLLYLKKWTFSMQFFHIKPFLKKHPILFKLGTFTIICSKYTHFMSLALLHIWWTPTDLYDKFCKIAPQKACISYHVNMNVSPSPLYPLRIGSTGFVRMSKKIFVFAV